jgi:hypothetical protein
MTKKQQVDHPKSRWKALTKDELDGGQRDSRDAGIMRKNNRIIEARRKAAKKRTESNP